MKKFAKRLRQRSTMIVAAALTVLIASVVVGSATSATKGAAATKGAGKQLVFGYISPGPDTWYQRDVDGFKYAAAKYGVKVVVLNSQYDQQKELANVTSLVNQGVDGISMFSFNTNGAITAAQQGQKNDIPVVLTDDVGHAIKSGATMAASVDFDWCGMGKSYANYMAKTWPGQNYAMLAGNFQAPPTQVLDKCLMDQAKALGKNPLVSIQQTMYNPATAVTQAQDLVQSGKKFTVLFTMNDDMGAAVARYLKSKNLLNNPIHLMTENGSPVGLQMMKDGQLQYSVSSSPGWEGMVAFLALYKSATGHLSATGSKEILLPVIPITPKSMDPTKVVPWTPGQVHWTLTKKYFPWLLTPAT